MNTRKGFPSFLLKICNNTTPFSILLLLHRSEPIQRFVYHYHLRLWEPSQLLGESGLEALSSYLESTITVEASESFFERSGQLNTGNLLQIGLLAIADNNLELSELHTLSFLLEAMLSEDHVTSAYSDNVATTCCKTRPAMIDNVGNCIGAVPNENKTNTTVAAAAI